MSPFKQIEPYNKSFKKKFEKWNKIIVTDHTLNMINPTLNLAEN